MQEFRPHPFDYTGHAGVLKGVQQLEHDCFIRVVDQNLKWPKQQ